MKAKLAPIIIFASFLFSGRMIHANLIDFTPEGFDNQHFPPSVVRWIDNVERNLSLFDVAVLNHPTFGTGWVGNGFIAGGTFFNTNLFSFTNDPAICQISWNFTGASNWELSWIWVMGSNLNNIYQIPLDQLLAGDGTITLNGTAGIDQIAFFGQHVNPDIVPDDTNTGALFVLAVGLLLLLTRAVERRTKHAKRDHKRGLVSFIGGNALLLGS
jgi:hypothetical protein